MTTNLFRSVEEKRALAGCIQKQMFLYGYHNCKLVEGTKNLGVVADREDGIMVYLKLHRSYDAALLEFKNIQLMSIGLQKKSSFFSVPNLVSNIGQVEAGAFVAMRYVNGYNGIDSQTEGSSSQAFTETAIRATAMIHAILSPYHIGSKPDRTDLLYSNRLAGVLRDELYTHLVEHAITLLSDFVNRLCAQISAYTSIVDLVFYKDSNPANWLVSRDDPSISILYAIDFEGRRWAPFWLDVINIIEL